jgi:hypothetical protein
VIYRDAYLSINANDVSAYLQTLELQLGRETQDDTAMGDLTRSNAAGLKTVSITANFHQSFVDNELDEILFGLFDAGTIFTALIRPTTGSISTSNPQYAGSVFISEYTPLTGSVGDQLVVPVTLVPAGNFTRATS